MIPRLLKSQLFKQHTFQQSRVLLGNIRAPRSSFVQAQSELSEANADPLNNNINGENSKSETLTPEKRVTKPLSRYSRDGVPGEGKDYEWLDKILYSSYLERSIPPRGYKKERYKERLEETKRNVVLSSISPPVTLKYLLEGEPEEGNGENGEVKGGGEENATNVQFPYKVVKKTEFIEEQETCTEETEEGNEEIDKETAGADSSPKPEFESVAARLRKQAIDIGTLLEEEPNIEEMFRQAVEAELIDPGTPDPTAAPSNVPCGGCGAILHCQDKSIPGYISSEIFKRAKKADLMEEVCYRCSVLEAHQATLNVNVSAEDYPRIVGKIKETRAMVLLMVDLTDFPCSVWPGLMDIIGHRRPVFLVGNKVDLIPQDSPDYLKRIEDLLIKTMVEQGMLEANIIHTALISAKTGYGVEDLITKILNTKRKGDVFIMGCTNVGKSSLFNRFIQSDLCKPQASDLVQKATVSQWPGTTLNLLKFPMTSGYGWRKGLRERRLKLEAPALKHEEVRRLKEFKETHNPELAVLKGYVGKTFQNYVDPKEEKHIVIVRDPFVMTASKGAPAFNTVNKKPGQWDPEHPDFTSGHWVYDTPGAVTPNQILDLLTLPELMQSLPKDLIRPRTFFIKPKMTLFVAGLARIDYTEGLAPIRYSLFSNPSLPVTICQTNDADEVYKQALGSKVFEVPCGKQERLSQFPPLKNQTFDFIGAGHGYSCSDIVLSSIGWVAVTAATKQEFQLSVHTPDGKGIFVRRLSLLPYSIRWKGKRIRGTYTYTPHKMYVPKYNKWNS